MRSSIGGGLFCSYFQGNWYPKFTGPTSSVSYLSILHCVLTSVVDSGPHPCVDELSMKGKHYGQ